ncbi:MAG: CARDB domain-containing protein [Anaerolineae bacterium]
MSYLVVFIDDKIRDEQVAHNVNLDSTVSAEVERYVGQYGLPRRFLGGSRIEYELVRAADGTHLSDRTTFRQANITQGEILQLVSSKGRRVWQVVQRLLDEIESETIDQATGKIKDKIAEKAANQIRDKLAEIEKTQTGGQRVEQVRNLFRQVIRPPAPSPARHILEKVADKLWSAFLSVSVAVAISAVGAVLVYGLSSPSRDEQPIPTPTERVMTTATATEQPTPTPTERVMTTATATEHPTLQPAAQDTDGDGLNDNYEVEIGTDPNDPDSDDDGLSDGQEAGSCTSPLNPDTDGDGRSDGDEVNRGSDPCNPNDPPRDDDGDGLTNEQEHQLGTNPNDPDSDDDGLPDGQEAGSCTNPLDPDTDGDGRGDGDEVNQGTDPCDPNDPPRDDDRDGLTNEQEYQLGTNPNDPDSDDDGLLDGQEAGSCANPLDPDTDGDGLGDGDEVNRGSDPCNPNDPYAPMPDLIVEIVSIDKDEIVWREEPWTWIHYRVSNIGEATAEGAVYLRDWTNGSPTSGYMLVEGPIAPGGSVESRFAVGHDNLWPPGDYAVRMEVDYRSLIDEANEDNNFSGTIDFKVIPPNSGPQDFIGNWYNVDRDTRGTTRIDIGQEGDVTFVHGYGSCSPTDCDWGTVAAYASGSSLIAEYKFSFKVSHLEMTLEGDRLRVYSTHRFTDGTDRDYDLTEYFYRRTVQ